jgi:small subunit ribosomal protein S6
MRNQRYETVFILPSDLEEGKRKEILNRLDGVVERGGGIRVKREDWGVRRLAYAVKRYPKGQYYLLDYVGSAQIVSELERQLRMFEDVLRFLTVKTEDRVSLEAAEKEQAAEREKEKARQASLEAEASARAASKGDESAPSALPAEGAGRGEDVIPEAGPHEEETEEPADETADESGTAVDEDSEEERP